MQNTIYNAWDLTELRFVLIYLTHMRVSRFQFYVACVSKMYGIR